MGALAPIALWIPEDDVLLKNAAEVVYLYVFCLYLLGLVGMAGASLEALAKGAVRFSRRYTIEELQNRWYALLYDPDISEPASVDMLELESSSQSNKLGDSKGNGILGKRKCESVCSHYYAVRKRIRNEPFNDVDFDFYGGPTLDNCEEQLTIHNEHPVENCIAGDHVADHFDLHDSDFDVVGHEFSQVGSVDIATAGTDQVAAHAFHSKHQDPLGGEVPVRIVGGDCLYEFTDSVPHKSIEINTEHSYEHDNIHNNINDLEQKFCMSENNSIVQEIGSPGDRPCRSLFEDADLMMKSCCEFDAVNNNAEPICPGFGQSKGFRSPVSNCTATFQPLDYSSPDPSMPIWKTMEDMSTPSIPNNDLNGKDEGAGAATVCLVTDANQVSSSGYEVLHPGSQLEERMSDDGLNNSEAVSDGDFFAIPSSLFPFSDELFMDVDGKDMMDRSCFDGISSLLLNSPNDVHQDNIPSITKRNSSLVMDPCLIIPDAVCSVESSVVVDKLQFGYKACELHNIVPSSTLASNPHSPERQNGVICCTLNTEDPDIPCNDEAFLPIQVPPPLISAEMQHNSEDGSSFPLSTVEFSGTEMDSKRGSNHAKEGEFLAISQVAEPEVFSRMCSKNAIMRGVASELPERESLDMVPGHVGIVGMEMSHCGSTQVTPYPVSGVEMMEDNGKVEMGTYCEFDSSIGFMLNTSVHYSDHNENEPQKIIYDSKHQPDVPGAIQSHVPAQHGSFEMPSSEPISNGLISDQEVQLFEDINDVPHFSDIEALILDMDLVPYDEDSNTEVSRYQHVEAKRTILRLEQGAYSYMQRAIASNRAFAILYGRRSKHYIRKSEVSLGRATDDSSVDIDLTKEWNTNKISRRQAIIKMDEDGSFFLRNLGKGSMFVNGKEVATGHCIKLGPGCLIEMQIRSMDFIFETNQKVVRQYLAKLARKNQDKGSKFEWSPEGVS